MREKDRVERWLGEEATKSYDAYKAAPTRTIPASQVMQRIRKRAAQRRTNVPQTSPLSGA
jgi:hypothetical protein